MFASSSSPTLTSISLENITRTINGYLERKLINLTAVNHLEEKEKKAVLHLSHFIANFSKPYLTSQRESIIRTESLLWMKKWSNFSQLCQLMENSPFSNLSDSESNQFFLGEGLCFGVVVHYFSQFFQNSSPKKAAPFPLSSIPHADLGSCVTFYPFIVNDQILNEKTRHFRFLQASYTTAYAFKSKESMEFVPNEMLKKNKLNLVKRIPDLAITEKLAFQMPELVPELKKLINQENRGYLLALGGPSNHAIALHLRPPFHFLDPSNGIAFADKLEDLVIFLATYLNEKFPDHHSFALLEFASRDG
jgi:hypothetical protein